MTKLLLPIMVVLPCRPGRKLLTGTVVGPGRMTFNDPEIEVMRPGIEWVMVLVGEGLDGTTSGPVVGLATTTNVWLLTTVVLPVKAGKNGSTGTIVEPSRITPNPLDRDVTSPGRV